MRDPKMILVIEEERQAAVLENDRLRAELASIEDKCKKATWWADHERNDNEKLRAELANARLERDNIAALNSSLIAKLAETQAVLRGYVLSGVAKDRIISTLNERSAQYERDSVAKDARIAEVLSAFDGMSALCTTLRERIAELETVKIASAEINAMSSYVRGYIAALETACDPNGTIRENYVLCEENRGLRTECNNLSARAERAEARVAELEAGDVTMTKIPMTPQTIDWYKGMCAARERAERLLVLLQEARTYLHDGFVDDKLIARINAALAPSPAGEKT